jgi:hypothetical protein
MANANVTSQPGPGRQWFEKTLVQQRDGEEGRARLHHALRYWFRRDTLTPGEAFPLLIGISPDSLSHGDSHFRYLDGSLVCIAASMHAHGVAWSAESFDDLTALQDLQAVPVILAEMKRVWLSGGHPPRNPPGYFIEWACRKGFNVPWLESARHLDLIENAKGKQASAVASVDATEAVLAPLPSPAIATAFDGLGGWNDEKWRHYLGDPPKWLVAARTSKGSKRPGNAAMWNPVIIALALADKGVAVAKLDTVFRKRAMSAWRAEWEDKSEFLRG